MLRALLRLCVVGLGVGAFAKPAIRASAALQQDPRPNNTQVPAVPKVVPFQTDAQRNAFAMASDRGAYTPASTCARRASRAFIHDG